MEPIRDVIVALVLEGLESTGRQLNGELNDDAILLETGLDSLGFAILVAKLEQRLGYDPFVIMDTPVYPRTFGEFVGIYRRFESRRNS